jgi:hypothetical protein
MSLFAGNSLSLAYEFNYKRGVTQVPRDADQGRRRSARISKKQGRQTRRSVSSRDTKMPKIFKSDGLDNNADVAEQLIPSTFEEETNILSTENIETFRIHYIARYWQIRKDFLNYLEDFTTQDSLIGSSISTTSQKHESSLSKVSSPSVLSDDTEISIFQQSLMLMTSITVRHYPAKLIMNNYHPILHIDHMMSYSIHEDKLHN